jgi:CelD/BcsL family acetyltransferase involved in cellulose biosynthesis
VVAQQNLSEGHRLVGRPDDEEGVIAALRAYLMQQESAWDWLRWTGVRSTGAAQRWLDSQGRTRWEEPVLNYWLRLPASWTEFRATRTRNIKESLRKCYNSLKRAGHAFTFGVVAAPQPARAALERFLSLHAARAGADMAVRHADYFANDQARAFLRDYCESMAQRGELRIFELEIGGVVVASRVGFVLGRELYLYYSGYAPEWGRFSIMTTLVAETLKWAIQEGFAIANLSVGKDNSKLRWGPEETVFNQGVQLCSGWRSRLSFRLYDWVDGI